MRLGINGWRIHGQRTGVGRYLLNVVKHWTPDVIAGQFDEINFYTPQPIDREQIPLPENIRVRVLPPHWRMLIWENLRLAPTATDDVLFCPSYSRPLLARGKTVVTTFEATLHLYPQYYSLSARLFYDRLYGWSARHAALVVTTTETARRDVARSYHVPESRIRPVPLAPAEIFRALSDDPRVEATRARYLGTTAPFFLFVGKLTVRRNLPALLTAFAEFKRRTSLPHKLLIVGLNSINLNLVKLAAELGISQDFNHVEYVSDEDLILLYNAAQAFIMPYSYEALSLTALEAQATGTPVITVDIPGLREMTGGFALLISKPEVEEIVEAMSRLASDPALRNDLREKGLTHARRFSWERCSAETLAVLAEAAQVSAARVLSTRQRSDRSA